MSRPVIFSDIDGTLIDFYTYSYAAVAETVARLTAQRIPLVLCSSKTRVEQDEYRRELGIADPYIVENGSAIFIPAGYFDAETALVLELGVPAERIRTALAGIRRETGIDFQGYTDLTVAEVAAVTGLPAAAAARARQREYSETIVTPLSAAVLAVLRSSLARHGLAIVSGGKFHTVMGADSDKGTAVRRLTTLYRRQYGDIVTIGLGDSANDAPLLAAVDRPYLVQKPGGVWQDLGETTATRVPAVGPAGWNQVITPLLKS